MDIHPDISQSAVRPLNNYMRGLIVPGRWPAAGSRSDLRRPCGSPSPVLWIPLSVAVSSWPGVSRSACPQGVAQPGEF